MLEHERTYVHADGRVLVTTQERPCPSFGFRDTILMWSTCQVCGQCTSLVPKRLRLLSWPPNCLGTPLLWPAFVVAPLRRRPPFVVAPSPACIPRPRALSLGHIFGLLTTTPCLGAFGTGSRPATPILSMSDRTWKSSVGKYMELSFYDVTTVSQLETCGHTLYRNHHRFFALQDMVVRFAWEPVQRYEIALPPIILQVRG